MVALQVVSRHSEARPDPLGPSLPVAVTVTAVLVHVPTWVEPSVTTGALLSTWMVAVGSVVVLPALSVTSTVIDGAPSAPAGTVTSVR